MTRTPPTPAPPLLILTCAACGFDMPRSIARGLWIGDGAVTIMPDWSQQCPKCQHIHQPGDVLRFRLGGVGS